MVNVLLVDFMCNWQLTLQERCQLSLMVLLHPSESSSLSQSPTSRWWGRRASLRAAILPDTSSSIFFRRRRRDFLIYCSKVNLVFAMASLRVCAVLSLAAFAVAQLPFSVIPTISDEVRETAINTGATRFLRLWEYALKVDGQGPGPAIRVNFGKYLHDWFMLRV